MPNWIPALIAAGAALAESRSGRRNASPDGPLASLDPETRRRLLALKPDKLPGKGTDPSQYVIDLDNPCTNALITFRDKRWKQQKGYHQCYSQRGQRLKWLSTRFWAVRYVQILRHLRYVIKHSNPGGADWEAAVIALLIADSGVRPGTKGSKSLSNIGVERGIREASLEAAQNQARLICTSLGLVNSGNLEGRRVPVKTAPRCAQALELFNGVLSCPALL